MGPSFGRSQMGQLLPACFPDLRVLTTLRQHAGRSGSESGTRTTGLFRTGATTTKETRVARQGAHQSESTPERKSIVGRPSMSIELMFTPEQTSTVAAPSVTTEPHEESPPEIN